MIRPTGVPPSTRTSLGAPPTPRSGWRSKVANPGRKNASRKRDGLFDMVKWNDGERFSDEPQLATRSPVLILRSARAPTARQSRMGVRASRRMRTAPISGLPEIGRIEVSTWVRGPHASRRIAAQPSCGRMRARLGCDAPQHEGEHRHVGQRSHVEESTCGCGKRSRARLPCFRPVIYRELRNFNVWSGSRGPAAHRGCRMTPRAI